MSHATFFVQSVARSTTALTLMRTGLRREEQLTATFWWCLPSFSSNTLCSLSSGCTCLTCSFTHIDLCPASSTTVQAMQSWGKSSSCTLRPHRQHTSLHKCVCAHAWKWWSSVSVTKQGRYISLDTVHAWQYHMQVDNMHPYSAHVREHARPHLPSHVSFSPLLSLSPVSTINSLAVHVQSPQTQQFLHIIWDHSHTNAYHVMLYIGSPKKNQGSSLCHPIFAECCRAGGVDLPLIDPLPDTLRALYDNQDRQLKELHKHICLYNSTLAFTSTGGLQHLLVSSYDSHGPPHYKIHSKVYHCLGPLWPVNGTVSVFSQLYIYDHNDALAFQNGLNPQCDPHTMETLQSML